MWRQTLVVPGYWVRQTTAGNYYPERWTLEQTAPSMYQLALQYREKGLKAEEERTYKKCLKLDARYAISQLGLSDKVASLTTIATPHLGTPLADISSKLLSRFVRMLGRLIDLRAFVDLTTARMTEFNRLTPNAPGISYGSVVARSGQLRTHPLLWATHVYLSKHAGPNDGVVPAASQPWGEVVREIDADHWAQIGWSSAFDALAFYEDLMIELRGRGF